MKYLRYFLAFTAFLLALPVVLYLYVRIVVMNPGFFTDVLYSDGYSFSEKAGVSRKDTERTLEKLFRFVNGREESPVVVVVADGERTEFYNDRELRHLEDVRVLFRKFRIAAAVLIVFELTVWAGMIRKMSAAETAKVMACAEAVHVGIMAWVLGLVRTGPVRFITVLHRLLFDNTRWILNDTSDRLVMLFPKDLYRKALFCFAVGWVGLVTVLNLIVTVKIKKEKRKNAQ